MVKDTVQESGDKASAPKKAFDFLIKVVLGGTYGVGKTSLLQRYVQGRFQDNYIATIGVDFMVKEVESKNGDLVKLQAWDLAGQERFRTITNSYYRGAMGMLMIYDVTARNSFEYMDRQLNEVQSLGAEDIVIFLVGNKADNNDSRREVTYEEGKKFADENGIQFFETSARDNTNVIELFENFVEVLVDQYKKRRAEAAKNPNKGSLKPKQQITLKSKETNSKSKTCVVL